MTLATQLLLENIHSLNIFPLVVRKIMAFETQLLFGNIHALNIFPLVVRKIMAFETQLLLENIHALNIFPLPDGRGSDTSGSVYPFITGLGH